MAQTLRYSRRILAATALLSAVLAIFIIAAQSGEVRLGAGQVEIVFAGEEGTGLGLHINARECPPDCSSIGLNWARPADRANATIFEAHHETAPSHFITQLSGRT